MCGLAGIIMREGYITDSERYSAGRMLQLTKHRGPDDSGVCGISGSRLNVRDKTEELPGDMTAILGFNRLSIQDVSEAGRQPMLSPDGKAVITFNGEIYNTVELKQKLRKDFGEIIWRGHSDTEVILQLYVHYGFDHTIRMLNGMFALVIADAESSRLYIARDRYGIIPLHISLQEDKIVYCSELKGFLGLEGFDRSPDLDVLSKNMMYYHPSGSLYKNVADVPAGCYYVLTNGIIESHRYFDINDYRQSYDRISWDDVIQRTQQVLRDCVERQLISDVNLGVLLSGGIDSTLAAKYASDAYTASGRTIRGFSLINTNFPKYAEESYIDYAASRINVDLHKYDFGPAEFLADFEESVYASETFTYAVSMGNYYVVKNASRNVRVVLCGEGSDEISGGYREFATAKGSELARRLFGRLSRRLARFGVIYDSMEFLRRFQRNLAEDTCRKIFPQLSIEGSMAARKKWWDTFSGSAFDKVRKLYFLGRLIAVLEKQNKICMYHSVENRVPFLDNNIVDLMFSVPERYLMHPCRLRAARKRNIGSLYEGKYVFKKISEGIYGKDFAFRPKSWIDLPLAKYIASPGFMDYIRHNVMPSMASRGMIDINFFRECLDNLEAGSNTMCVWKALNAEVWFRIFADGEIPSN